MKTLVFLALIGISLAGPAFPNLEYEEFWQSFKSQHGKNYGGAEEKMRRFIFEDNLRYIINHNYEADLGKHTFRLGMNEYGDLSNEEYVKYLKGYRQTNLTKSDAPTFLAPEFMAIPDSIDWRQKGYVTPVKNQGNCGSCWAFSATGSLEGQHFKKTGNLVSLSEQQLVDCSTKYGNNGCNGGLMDNAFRYIKDNGGVDTETCYSYTARDGTCKFDTRCIGATCAGYVDVPRGSESKLEKAVASVGPVSVAIDASSRHFRLYKSGVYIDTECSSSRLDHGVLAVGYGTDDGQDYWIVKNSWGTTWGASGYIKMARNHDNMCGIATQASYPLV